MTERTYGTWNGPEARSLARQVAEQCATIEPILEYLRVGRGGLRVLDIPKVRYLMFVPLHVQVEIRFAGAPISERVGACFTRIRKRSWSRKLPHLFQLL